MDHRESILLPVIGAALAVLVVAGLLALPMATKKTPQDHIGLSYGGGIFEGEEFQKIVNPGQSRFFNGWFDKLYQYPVTQRNYIISQREEEGDVVGADSIVAPTKDRIPITFEVATYFKLNIDKLREFHENIGLKYAAWTSSGWLQMLNDSFRQQIEFALQRTARQFNVADIYSDETTLLEIQREVGENLKDNVTKVLGDEYFCGPTFVPGRSSCPEFTFVVKKATPPDAVVAEFENNRRSEIAVLTKKNEVRQSQQEARAIRILQEALDSFGGDSFIYALLKAIESGVIDFWVLPDNGKFTFQTPNRDK